MFEYTWTCEKLENGVYDDGYRKYLLDQKVKLRYEILKRMEVINNMTRKEEYQCTILTIYVSGKIFIEMSKKYGLGKEQLDLLIDSYLELFDIIMLCALRDDFIIKNDYLYLSEYVNKLSGYLKECCE